MHATEDRPARAERAEPYISQADRDAHGIATWQRLLDANDVHDELADADEQLQAAYLKADAALIGRIVLNVRKALATRLFLSDIYNPADVYAFAAASNPPYIVDASDAADKAVAGVTL
jgi:hypothetical protein